MKKTEKPNPVGRPSKYDPKYCEEIIEYFSIEPYYEREITKFNKKDGKEYVVYEDCANDLRFISGFAHSIDISTMTIHRWADKHEEFSYALKKAKELQQTHLVTNGLKGLYQTAFAIFTAKNITEMRDKTEVETTHIFTKMPTIEVDGKEVRFDVGD